MVRNWGFSTKLLFYASKNEEKKKNEAVLIPAKGDLTQKLTVEMHKSVAFEPAPTPEIDAGMVTDLEEVTNTLKANDTCIASSSCAIEIMTCGPQN